MIMIKETFCCKKVRQLSANITFPNVAEFHSNEAIVSGKIVSAACSVMGFKLRGPDLLRVLLGFHRR